jgi:uncharacterized protein (DUF305 family)
LLALLVVVLAVFGSGCTRGQDAAAAPTSGPVVLQAGAPGEAPERISAEAAEAIEPPPHTPADVAFVAGMLHHHAQALDMTALVADRTSIDSLASFAERMDISQYDEIDLMVSWLEARGEPVPDVGPGSAHARGDHDEHMMPGMLTGEQMDRLAAADGVEFDLLFLDAMTFHHEGALLMVEDLYALEDGSGQDNDLFTMASHIDADQRIEIDRMAELREEVVAGS